MELIYTDNQMTELGDIKDFEFDLAYGKDENDFEIKTPENEMQQGYYWYVKDTNYGGVVDEIEGTTNAYEVTYRGRSFQGILASYSAWQLKSNWYMTVNDDTIYLSGTPYDITVGIIEQLGIDIKVEQPTSEQSVITETVDRSLDIYQLMRYAFEKNSYKINLYFDGGIRLDVTGAIDYASDSYFDVTRFRVKVNKKDVPNHLIGVFKRDEDLNIIKHLYADEKGIIQPYFALDEGHEIPVHDLEYERIPDQKVIEGLNERVSVITGGSNVESYDVVSPFTEPSVAHPYGTGNTEYEYGVPKDWNENCYTDYYQVKKDENGEVVFDDKGLPQYVNFEIEYENYNFVVQNPRDDYEVKTLDWFKENWTECFKASDDSQLTANDCPVVDDYGDPILVNANNADRIKGEWWKYYYEVSSGNYAQVPGLTKYNRIYQTSRGAYGYGYWYTNTGDYWFTWKRRKWKVHQYNSQGKHMNSMWVYETSADGTPTINSYVVWRSSSQGSGGTTVKTLLQYEQFNGGNITSRTKIYRTKSGKKSGSDKSHIEIEKPVTTGWSGDVSVDTYCAMTGKTIAYIKDHEWKSGYYFLKDEYEDKPDTLPNPVYFKSQKVQGYPAIVDEGGNPIIYYYKEDKEKPEFTQGDVYKKVNDHYTNLCQTMIDKYNEMIAQASVIEPTVDTDIGEFDVGDIIGSVHPFTNEPLSSKLTKKIIKGDTNKVEVSYEIG